MSSVTKKKDIKYQMYIDCLHEKKEMYHSQVAIRSKHHQMGVYQQVKKSLSPLDTKKWILADGITSYAYGHYRIPYQHAYELYEMNHVDVDVIDDLDEEFTNLMIVD